MSTLADKITDDIFCLGTIDNKEIFRIQFMGENDKGEETGHGGLCRDALRRVIAASIEEYYPHQGEEVCVQVPLRLLQEVLLNLDNAQKPTIVFTGDMEQMRKEADEVSSHNISSVYATLMMLVANDYREQ